MIDKPVEGVKTDARPHPAGSKGAKLSLQEVSDRSWKARMSPRLRSWATQQLDKCGASRGGRREKAKCILNAFRKKVPYIADPVMGEFMATPDQSLCLDEGGLCFIGGDCDDHSIGLSALMMSIGIPAMIIGASYRDPVDTPTHVYMAFEDDLKDWVRMDGTTNLPVGSVIPYAKEWWIEPGKRARENGEGDFVGMADGTLAASTSMLDLLYPGIR